jgi:hypothetical protein
MILPWASFEGKHQGQRCFILGNAPCLLNEPLGLLNNDIVIVTNRGYKILEHGLKRFEYHCIVDLVFYEDYAKEIAGVDMGTKFLPHVITEYEFYQGEDFVPVYTLPTTRQTKQQKRQLLNDQFPKSYTEGWGKTGNAVLNASLIAYFMGFTEIYLLGVEMTYTIGSTHFYKDTSARERSVPDGYRSKGIKFLPHFVKFFREKNVIFRNLTPTFAYKDIMDTGSLTELNFDN